MIVGLVEAMTGLGLIVGPIIGSALYSAFGYKQTFFIYGSFLVFLSIVIKICFQTKARQHPGETSQEKLQVQPEVTIKNDYNTRTNEHKQEEVGYFTLLKEARFTLAALSSALCYFTYSFMEPILA